MKEKALCLFAAWLVLALAAAGWWSRLHSDSSFREQYFSADLVVWPTVIEDVIVRGNPFARSWHLTPAPYFVPDALFALGTRAVGQTIEGRQYANIAAQLVCLVLALLVLARAIDRDLSPIAPALGALCIAFALQGREPFVFGLYPSYHVGVSILGASALALALHPSRGRVLALTVLLIAGTASDPLLTIFWAGGVALTALGVAWREGQAAMLQRVLVPGGAGTVGCVVGWALSRTIPFPERAQPFSGLTALGETAQAASVHWTSFDDVFRVSLVAGALSLALVAVLTTEPLKRMTALFLLGGALATVAMIFVSGQLVDGGWNRYLLWPTLSGWVGILLMPTPVMARWGVTLVAATVVIPTVARSPLQLSTTPPQSQWTVAAKCLDTLARQESVTGIAGYWQAKPLSLFSREGVAPAQFSADLDAPMLWITSRSWYWPGRDFGFVVTTGLNVAEVDRALGANFVEHQCGELAVRLYQGKEREALSRLVDERVRRAMGGP